MTDERRYFVIAESTLYMLQEMVARSMEDGWVPIGGVAVATVEIEGPDQGWGSPRTKRIEQRFYQAMQRSPDYGANFRGDLESGARFDAERPNPAPNSFDGL